MGELAGNEDMLYTDGDGSSEEQAIWIRKARDFEKINENLDGYYKLARGIDLSDVDFQPIGGEGSKNNFTGTFDGNGYKITGLHVEAAKDEKPLKYAGLFTYCKNAEIKNVVLVDPQVTTGEYGGALAGVLSSTNVENCQVIGGTVTWDDTSGSCYLGGLAGDVIGDSTLKDCSSTADVTAEGTATSVVYVGGLIGEGYLNTTVDGCTASGNVTMTGDMQDEDTIALGRFDRLDERHGIQFQRKGQCQQREHRHGRQNLCGRLCRYAERPGRGLRSHGKREQHRRSRECLCRGVLWQRRHVIPIAPAIENLLERQRPRKEGSGWIAG